MHELHVEKRILRHAKAISRNIQIRSARKHTLHKQHIDCYSTHDVCVDPKTARHTIRPLMFLHGPNNVKGLIVWRAAYQDHAWMTSRENDSSSCQGEKHLRKAPAAHLHLGESKRKLFMRICIYTAHYSVILHIIHARNTKGSTAHGQTSNISTRSYDVRGLTVWRVTFLCQCRNLM